MKTALKGQWFQDAKGIQKNTTAKFNAVPLGTFDDCFATQHSNPKTAPDSRNKKTKLMVIQN